MLQFLNDLELSNTLESITQITKDLYSKHFCNGEKLCIHLKGLEYMNDDPSEVDVLYAKVEDSTKRIQNFVDELVKTLSSFPCVRKEKESVKLHATLMNTIFRLDDTNNCTNFDKPNKCGKKQRVTFDARDIFESFEDFDFARIPVNSIDINVRGRFESNGLYRKSAAISLV
nr:activating signal cointegrator 1 complex subunit 1 [Hydra vulgaris]